VVTFPHKVSFCRIHRQNVENSNDLNAGYQHLFGHETVRFKALTASRIFNLTRRNLWKGRINQVV